MNSLRDEKTDIVNISNIWDGSKYIELQHLSHKLWTRVFHPRNGPCYTFDLTNIENFRFIPYLGYTRPTIDFYLSENIPWETLTILLHSKYDF